MFNRGATTEQSLQESIARENDEHHDIVQGDFLDTYRNLSYKNIMGKLWVSQFCQQVFRLLETGDWRLELSLAMHRRATWCYLYNCYNNIYRDQ